jgi:telomerase reverse transcriptase
MDWLAPRQLMANKTSLTDIQKRLELLNEFLYFLIDSFLIPLIRSNFYVTESNTDKYRIFFFRHDIWRSLVEPAMITLKGKMLEEISILETQNILDSRRLGFSHIRLLPKGRHMRPITNLRKRVPVRGKPRELGPGINKILAPVHTVLQLEKVGSFVNGSVSPLIFLDH